MSFSRAVWIEVTKVLGVKQKWDEGTLEECLLDSITNRAVAGYKALPCLFVYGISIGNNKMVFQDQLFSPSQVA